MFFFKKKSQKTFEGLLSTAGSTAWREFLRALLGSAAAIGAAIYLFVITIDPWDTLPLSPPLPRVPISTNARFSFPGLARKPRFDSAILGTSTSRLLRPDRMDPRFGAHFVNLAMNSATAWEQSELLGVFARAHPGARWLVIGLDAAWCATGDHYERTTPRPFPDWMYDASPWHGYREMFSLYALQEAANQAGVMLGIKRERYGRDGYTNFLPPETAYDPARVSAKFRDWGLADDGPATPEPRHYPAHALLAADLASLPNTSKLLFFVPDHVSQQGVPGSDAEARWAGCKASVTAIARADKRTTVADFLIPSAITTAQDNYWDPYHYRAPIADRVTDDLAAAASAKPGEDYRLLVTQAATPAP